ncbi:MAG: hypothetical protein ONB51_09395 [candidate division KSB1 bacterium]|nr:hypothetical protein [candidate division KSB1 bacterium]
MKIAAQRVAAPSWRILGLALFLATAPAFGQGSLTQVTVTPSDTTAGKGAIYKISFITSLTGGPGGAGIPANGKIRLSFPPSFVDSTVTAAFNDNGLDGGYAAIADTNHVITLTRDSTGTALAAGDTAVFSVAIVYNSTLADSFRIFVQTLNAAGVAIDSARSAFFRIAAAPLHHFKIDSVATQTAGDSFFITISARDVYENLVKTFKRKVSISLNADTITPALSDTFVLGQRLQKVVITRAGEGRIITVKDSLNHTGSSNAFRVNPGPLHHIGVSLIATPQTAGAGFAVTFTAQDSLNNTVTTFTGPVTIADLTGTVTPVTSGAFNLGVRTETLRITQASTNNRITVSGGGKNGQSNFFDVNAGALDRFVLSVIPDPQVAGNSFLFSITARDANNNNVSYSGTVTLTDNTGTLTPTSVLFAGEATKTVNAMITKAQSNVVITASGSGRTGQSNSFTVNPAALDHFEVTSTGGGSLGSQTAGSAFAIRIVARDRHDNIVTSHSGPGSAVTLSNTTASLSPASSGNFSNGILASQTVTITRSASADAITVSHGATGRSGVSNNFAVLAGPHADFRLDPVGSPQTAGVPFPLVVRAVDAYENIVTGFTGTVNLAVNGGGTITPNTSGNFVAGVWNGSVSISNTGSGRVITVSGNGFNETSTPFDVTANGIDHFVIDPVGNQTAGQNFSVTIRAKDANDNDVAFSGPVTLTDNTGTLKPDSVTFSNQASLTVTTAYITKAQSNVVITASGSAKPAQSNSFTVAPADLDHFDVTSAAGGNIASQTAGTSFTIKLVARDAFNNVVTSFNSGVTMSNTTGSLVPSSSGNFTNGELASLTVTITKTSSADAISVSGGTPARNGVSNNFAVNAGPHADFRIANIASPQTAGVPFPVIVRAVDAHDNTVTGFTGTVNLTVSGGGTISPNVSSNFINGVWNGSVSISNSGTNRQITVSNGGFSEQSNPFTVNAGSLDRFVIDTIGTQTAGQNFSVTVRARDANNNEVAYTGTVTLSDNTGTLTASALVFSGQTFRTISDARITKAQTGVVITASGSGKVGQSAAFTVNPDLLDHFSLTNTSGNAIGTQTAGTPFTIRIVARDQYYNTVTGFNQPVILTDLTGLNITTANFSNGVLASQSLTITQARSDNQLTASGGVPAKSGTSNLFNVVPAALDHFAIDNITDQAAGVPFTITLRALDVYNNLVTGYNGAVTLSDLTGTIAPASSGAFIGGVRNESVTITQTRTANRINVSGSGKTGSSNSFNVIASTVDHFDISTIGNQTAGVPFSVTIIARDASNNTVTGFNGTVTVSDGTGTVSPATSNPFTAGTLTQNFTITKSAGNNRLTVTGVGKSSSSNAFNVSHAALTKFHIAPLTDQVAGQSFPLILTAQDQYDNTVMNFSGTVSIAINSGTIQPANSGAFSAGVRTEAVTVPQAGGNRVITVNDGAGHSGSSNAFNVNAAGLDRFVFSNIGTQAAGAPFSFTITARDANGNDVSFIGTLTLSEATGTLSPTTVAMNGTSVTVTNAVITRAQNGLTLTASGGGKTGTSNSFNVNPGPLQRVRIVESNGVELGAKSLNADQSLTVRAAGYDAYNNYAGDQTVTWLVQTVTGSGIGEVSPVTGSTTIFNAKKTGTGRLVADHASVIDDSSGVITITPGAAFRVKILAGTAGNSGVVTTLNLTTGATFDMHAASFDVDDNYIQDVSVTWSVTGGIGDLNPSSGMATRFIARSAGSGQITADHASLIDYTTGAIQVNAGNLARIRIVEGPSGDGPPVGARTLTTDDLLKVHAAGYDAEGNYLGDESVTWRVRNGIGVVTPTVGTVTDFDPRVPGSGRLVADHGSVPDDSTGVITVNRGQAFRIKVLNNLSGNTAEVQSPTLTTGETLPVHASSFDRDNNYIGDVSVSWSVSGNIGTLSTSVGSSTVFTATTPNTGVITGTHPTLESDATGPITVIAGNLSYIRIVRGPSGNGPELGNLSLTTDDVLELHAAGYDANGNYLGDQNVTWTVTNNIGTLTTISGSATMLVLRQPGTGRVQADHAFATDDVTGDLSISVGALHHIKVLLGGSGQTAELENDSLTTDESRTVHAGGFDADDNYREDVSVNWSVTNGIGVLTPTSGLSTTLNATKVGAGQIRATHANAGSDLTGTITVTPGALSYVKVVEGPAGPGGELGNKTLTADQELTLHAAGFDADNNYIRDESVTWSSAGTLLPAITASGTVVVFRPTKAPASGTIRATHASAGFDNTGTITVNVGALHHVVVLSGLVGETAPQGNVTLNPGQTLPVHAGGYDADNNYISDEVVNWSLDGSIGNLSTNNGISTTFTAVTEGTGSIRTLHPNPAVINGNSGTISVIRGQVSYIVLRTAPNNGGAPYPGRTMNTDQEIAIYAAGYDVGNNYLGDVQVTWSSTGTLAPPASGTGSSFTFAPSAGAADGSVAGKIVGTYSPGIAAETGVITVLPGAPKGAVTLTPVPASLPADGASTAVITSSLIRDAEGNLVGPGRTFTVSITPQVFGAIVEPDVDSETPGHQIATTAQSRLQFTFRAGTLGGSATINVTSGLSANGSTTITLGSLSIVSISTNPTFVSQGQSGINVSMSVQNLGTATIQDLAGGLTFQGTVDRTADYIVTPGVGNPTSIPGNSTRSLSFDVTVKPGAALELITINGNVSGTINGTPVSSNNASNKDTWTVLRPASLTVQSVTTARDTVARGQTGIAVTVRIANNLGISNSAPAVIDSVRLKFSQGLLDKTGDYIVAANPGNPTVLAGNEAKDFSFIVNVGLGASTGTIMLDAAVYGRDSNSVALTSDLNATTTDSWVVIEGNAFRIVSLTPSQSEVTVGMTREWNVRMVLQNLAPSNVNLDLAATRLTFTIGSQNVTSQYTIAPPTMEGGGTVLPGNSTRTLIFRITQTGSTPGIAGISGVARGMDSGTGLQVSDDTNDGGGSEVNVQTRGVLNVVAVQASQPNVTAGRSFPWTITATVTNSGGSAIKLKPDSIAVAVGSSQGYVFDKPRSFADGDSIIAGLATKTLRVTVTQTGLLTGSQPLTLRLKGVELNSNRELASNIGSGSVTVQSAALLEIVSVRPSQVKVTAGQTMAWNVVVAVRNHGESQVSVRADTSTNLRFRLGNQFQSGYTALLQPAYWLGTSSPVLLGGRTDSLRFNVTITGSNPGFVRLWPKVAAIETNSNVTVADTTIGRTLVEVQTIPVVTYLGGSLTPKIVNNGGVYAFKVGVINSGTAEVELLTNLTRLRFSSGGVSYLANLDANMTTRLAGNDTTILTFQQQVVPADMPKTTYTPTIELRGSHNGNGFNTNLTTNTNELTVTGAGQVQVVSLRSSQATVTQNMDKDWFVMMTVTNNGDFDVRLQSVDLQMFNGGQVTGEYDIVKPATFRGSGGVILAPKATDSLRFEIRRTGIKRGPTTVIGLVRVIDQSNGRTIEAVSDGSSGSFVVQSPALLDITSLAASQSTLTREQTRPWTVDLNVTNRGESEVQVDFAPAETRIDFGTDGGSYVVEYPTALLGGGNRIAGGASATLQFRITRTGTQTGPNSITARLRATELNSGEVRLDDTDSGGGTSVTVQTPAMLQILSTVLTPNSAPNLPRVNTNQSFGVQVEIYNSGEESTQDVRVRLASSGGSVSNPAERPVLGGVPGLQARTVNFTLSASASENPNEVITATIAAATAGNTLTTANLAPPVDHSETVIVQRPAGLYLSKVIPSITKVNAESGVPWFIRAVVQDTGGAVVKLDPPQKSDIVIKINDVVQEDYVITPPAALVKSGDLLLRPGEVDTLIYTVTRTGGLGGLATLQVAANGVDVNNNQRLRDSRNSQFEIVTTAAVFVRTTTAVVNNFFAGTSVGLVNTNQNFRVNVEIENSGFEDVENVLVELATDGGSLIPTPQQMLARLPLRQRGMLSFAVQAAAVPTPGVTNERFVARILSATAASSGGPALIFSGTDTTALVRIQLPARLALTASVEKQDLTTREIFRLSARVSNRANAAAVDGSGRLTVFLPSGFEIIGPVPGGNEQSFTVADSVSWSIRAPDIPLQLTPLVVRMTTVPMDLNSRLSAEIENDADSVQVEVVKSDLSVLKTYISEPAGARDGTVSTGQEFMLVATLQGSRDLSDRRIQLLLPGGAGYNLTSESPTPLLLLVPAEAELPDTVRWEIAAPGEPAETARQFVVVASGRTGLGTIVTARDTLAVTTVSKARLDFSVSLYNKDNVELKDELSVGQTFKIRARLSNLGRAGVVDSARVALQLGQTGVVALDELERYIPVDGVVEWLAQAPATPTVSDFLTLRITKRPFDENIGLEAAWAESANEGLQRLPVRTELAAAINPIALVISDPEGATDGTVSTEQEFKVQATISGRKLVGVKAELFPATFEVIDNREIFISSLDSTKVSTTWRLKAPLLAMTGQLMHVRVSGRDRNSGEELLAVSPPLKINVVARATLALEGQITEPLSAAADGVVGLNQIFTITARVVNLGTAQVNTAFRFGIQLPEGYATPEPLEQNTTAASVRWRIKARSTPSTTQENILLELKEPLPFDENTNRPAEVRVQRANVSIQTEPKRLIVAALSHSEGGPEDGPVARGQENVPAMTLRLLNDGRATSSNILLKALAFHLLDRNGNAIPPSAAIKRLRVVSHANPAVQYGQLSAITGTNPLLVSFTRHDSLHSGVPNLVDVLVDIADNVSVKNFKLAFINSDNIEAIDEVEPQPRVQVVSSEGLSGSDFVLASATLVPFDDKFETSFYNYPNPFAPRADGSVVTRFNYFLPQDSEVEFRIFTLLGELVYAKSYKATDPQGRAGSRGGSFASSHIEWNGLNSGGNLVLNGVYVAILKTRFGVTTTKVAVVK